MIDHVKAKDTRKSIKKLFPLGSVMSMGSNNPITLHSADEHAFARVWSLIAETMVANGELSRNTKEKIADLVSNKNECPICATAHSMMVVATEDSKEGEGKDHITLSQKQALDYAEALIEATRTRTTVESWIKEEQDFSLLNDKAKAEIAMVVLVFTHMNRVVSAILGEEMATAMFSVPRPVARTMERSSFMNVVNGMMKPFLYGALHKEHALGCTEHLFSGKPNDLTAALPLHLQGSLTAGTCRGNVLARLLEWVDYYYKRHLKAKDILPQNVLDFLEDPESVPPPFYNSERVVKWASKTMNDRIEALEADERQKELARILLVVRFAPKTISRGTDSRVLAKTYGMEVSRSILIWWSLRVTLKQAKGLAPTDLNTE